MTLAVAISVAFPVSPSISLAVALAMTFPVAVSVAPTIVVPGTIDAVARDMTLVISCVLVAVAAAWRIFRPVPVFLHKVGVLIAGVVLAAML